MNRCLATAFCILAWGSGAQAKAVLRPACLAGYRSPEYLVGWSPLILIGAVEEVHEDLEEDKKRPVDGAESEKPTQARVRILQVLKGRYDRSEIRVGSGPIESCAPWPVHYGFKVGEKKIFILPEYPKDGAARLLYSGSLLECEKASMILARLSWARAYRASYLEAMRQILPKAHQDALDLAKDLRREFPSWPKDGGWPQESAEFTKAKTAVLQRLAKLDVEAIRIAVAEDWLDPAPENWWRTPLWTMLLRELASLRGEELEQAERKRLDRELEAAGVESEFAKRYRASVSFCRERLALGFPPAPLHPENTESRDDLTTEFILRWNTYDRGAIFQYYGMCFDVLADLDPDRVSHLLPQLFGSDDEHVHLVAYRAIERIPGTPFVDVVLRRILEDHWAWMALEHPKDPQQTADRLKALVEQAEKTLSPYGLAAFWRSLHKGECFKIVCIDRAIAGLGRIKAADAKEPLAESLHDYLQGAMSERESPAQRLSADDYKSWFVSHPPVRRER